MAVMMMMMIVVVVVVPVTIITTTTGAIMIDLQMQTFRSLISATTATNFV